MSEVWAIKYEDADVADEVFVGEGAEDAATRTYARRTDSWNCYLLGPVEALRAKVATLEAENGRLRAVLEIARERGHNVDYWLMEARAQQPSPAQQPKNENI